MVVTATPDWEARLPPVAAIRAAFERERAMRVLSGQSPPPVDQDAKDPVFHRALLQRLRWPRDGARRPWRAGVSMLGDGLAPWRGIGCVVKTWSGASYCTVWRKLPLDDFPNMKQWRSQHVGLQELMLAIVTGHITDAYP